MKRNYKYFALVCASILIFGGCVEENLNIVTPAEVGDEIIFGARAGFENGDPDTKTIYSGVEYTYNGTKFERIDWLTKQMSGEGTDYDWYDMIEIHSPEAINGPTAHYEVNEDANTSEADKPNQNGTHLKDYAYLLRSGNSGLQWGEGSTVTDDNGTTTGVHHFYAMYPSHKLFEGKDNTLYQGIKMDGTILTGIVPAAQAPERIEEDGNGNYVAVPNMKYAYMAARTTASRNDGNVALTFVPIVTAVEIELELSGAFLPEGSTGDVVPVSIGEIQVQGSGIAGTFTANLSTVGDNPWSANAAYPTCVNATTGSDLIQITMFRDGQPLKIEKGNTLTFTVFLRPGASVSGLTVKISPTGASYVSKKIEKTIKPKVKTRIKNLYLPTEGVQIDAGNWMEQLDPNISFKRLSLPGTSGSFSSGSSDARYRSQTLTFDEQWELGIRAFEIITNRPSSQSTSLGGEPLTCNQEHISNSLTLNSVMTTLTNKVRNSNECAVAILVYQPEGTSPRRNADGYAQSLMAWYNNFTNKSDLMFFSPDLTLEQARGKVLVVVRLNQKDEPERLLSGNNNDNLQNAATNFTNAVAHVGEAPFLLVNGCGTGKDRWGSRGYLINNITSPDISNAVSDNNYIEYYMNQGTIININDPNSPVTRGDINFGFSTNKQNITCWYQDWSRVVLNPLTKSWSYTVSFWNTVSGSTTWFESYNEKLDNVKTTFEMAISDEYKSYIFINSLSGYLVDETFEVSYTPSYQNVYGGAGGNIEGLASKINEDFYPFVLTSGMEQKAGPTGIVMMDYVAKELTYDTNGEPTNSGSYYLPGVIIANNFKYGSGNSNNSGNGGQNDNQNPGGNSGGNTGGSGNQGGGNGGEDAM